METNKFGRSAKCLGSNLPEQPILPGPPGLLPAPTRIPPMPAVKPPKSPTNGTSAQKDAQPPPEK